MTPAIPKVAIAPERWTQTVFGTPDSALAKAEVSQLGAMRFNTNHWSNAYLQCIGRGISHKECVASLPDDVRTAPAGPLSGGDANAELAATIACMGEHGDPDKCTTHFDALSKLAGFEEERKKGSMEKASEFCNKAGYKLLGVPVLFYAMKFIKVK
eukprot:CAMPEP_0115227964 /NCGR_PEP_ID=MMETSP0270-20121206/31420_1 /TAXON_ID=71861 /ORGANISM="Scrippsiella trochoidea, Strain CCMP3099" /LENGTH=155 /DNA_ID=CAMNT_0002642439 /DNA_START=72 /DNA_END=539 /DNA_ORIENTATION=+